MSIESVDAAQAVFSATENVLNRGSSFSFDSASDLLTALQAISKTSPSTLSWTQVVDADVLARVLSSVAGKFDVIVSNASSAKQALIGLAQTEYLIQNDLLLALGQEPKQFPESSFLGSGLDRRLAEIAEVVGPVTGPAQGQRGLAERPDAATESGQTVSPGQVLFDENDLDGKAIQFSVKLANANPQPGDRLIFFLEGKEVGSDTLTEADIGAGFAKTELDTRIFSGLAENQLLRLVARIDTPQGVQGLTSRALQVFLDRGVPTPTLKLISEDTGNVDDGITYMPPVFRVGQVERGAQIDVEIYRGKDSLGELKLSQSGEFTTSLETLLAELPIPQPLVDGNYRLGFIQSDLAGHRSPTANVSVVLDQTAPLISLQTASVTMNPQSTKTLAVPAKVDEEVSWTADIIDFSSGLSLKLEITNGLMTGDFKALKDGDHKIRLIAEDMAGNENYAELDLVIDSTLKVSTSLDQRNKGLSAAEVPLRSTSDTVFDYASNDINIINDNYMAFASVLSTNADHELRFQLSTFDTMKLS